MAHRQDRRRSEVQERHVADRTSRSRPSCAGWMPARRWATPKTCRAAKQWPADNEWKAAKELGEPDLVIKSDPYTMPAHHQDVWWRPTSEYPDHRAALGARCRDPAGHCRGRKITHHAVAYLVQDDPSSLAPGGRSPTSAGARCLMEWAIGKGYDLIARTPASCCCRARRFPGTCIFTRSAKRFAITSSSASGSIRRARSRSTAAT